MAQWLYRFGGIDVRIHDDDAFLWSCKNKHVDMARWLLAICPDITERLNVDFGFKWSCVNKQFDLFGWPIK